ncbi:MAG: exodeoxyribonuclease III [Pseudomonadota bacterium]|nr:MAG: exodeoxyribonuclease III [Pseudomonadota bacterium]
MWIATWNVNSIRARRERLLAWLERRSPDVVLLQELKCQLSDLEAIDLAGLGYHVAANTQRTYNGVAILSKTPLEDVVMGLQDDVEDPQARLVAATTRGIRFLSAYVPNGSEVSSEKWAYKLQWLERLRLHLERHYDPGMPLVLGGDFNVAPDERDVHDPAEWETTVLFHPEARQAYRRLLDWGLEDTFRIHNQEPGTYSWWDYRMLAFPKNRGLRIDLILATRPLRERVAESFVDRDERKGKQPSDHAPVLLRLHD